MDDRMDLQVEFIKQEIEIDEITFPERRIEYNEGHNNVDKCKIIESTAKEAMLLGLQCPPVNTHMDVEESLIKDEIEIEEFTFPQLETENHSDLAQHTVSAESTDGSNGPKSPLLFSEDVTSVPASNEASSPSVQKTNNSTSMAATNSTPSNEVSVGSRIETCTICNFTVTNNETLIEHCSSQHTVDYISMGVKTYQRPLRVLHCKVEKCMWKTKFQCVDRKDLISQLKIHSQIDHNIMFLCHYCLGMFKNREQYCNHNTKYHPNHKCEFFDGVKCDCRPTKMVRKGRICKVERCTWSTTTTNKKQLLTEVHNHVKLKHKSLLACNYCLNIFTTAKQRHSHTMEKHMKSCQICDFKHISQIALMQHCYLTHTVPNNILMVHDIELKRTKLKIKIIPCQVEKCDFVVKCGAPDQISFVLKLHCGIHHKGVEVCELCHDMFTSIEKLDDHINKVHVFQCKICECSFRTLKLLHNHCGFRHQVHSNWNCNTELVQEEITNQDNTPLGFETTIVNDRVVRTCLICGCKIYKANLLLHNLTFHLVSTDIDMSKINFTTPVIRKFQCKKCLMLFTRLFVLKNHYFKNHCIKLLCSETVIDNHSCTLCEQPLKFTSLDYIQQHYQNAHQQEFDVNLLDFTNWYTPIVKEQSTYEGFIIFSCKLCSDYCMSMNELMLHYSYIHSCYACIKCKAVFQTEQEQIVHLKQVHFVSCNMCNFESENGNTMIKHMMTIHNKVILDNRPTISKNANSNILCHLCPNHVLSDKRNAKMHYYWFHNKRACEYCWQAYHGHEAEHKHVLDHHMTECIHCNTTFDDLQTLNVHLLSNHQNENSNFCEVCGEHLNDRNALKLHRESHKHKNKKCFNRSEKHKSKFLCSKCGSAFHLKNTYERHMVNVHPESEENCGNFCTLCNKKYKNITLHKYISHKDIYEKENGPKKCKQLQCSFCKKMYDTISDLMRHMKRHSKYKCKQCPMQYGLLPHLEDHVSELHTSRYAYSCTVCNKLFPTEPDFNLHMTFHSPGSQNKQPELLPVLRCDLCDHFCLNRDSMEKHVKTKHIKAGKLINVKRKKPMGRKPYIKRVF